MRKSAVVRNALLAASLAALSACAVSPEEDPVMIKMNDLDRRLEKIERVVSNQSLLELSNQLQALQKETRALRGQLEELQHGSDTVRSQQRDLYGDLDKRLQAIEAGAAPLAADAAGAGVLPVPAGSDRANYQAAFDLLKNGQYDKALAAWKQFMVTFPDSALADNAQYWLGETHYVMRNFPEALKSFRRVVENWPESRKLADAWLKIGYTEYELKNWKPSRDALNRVVRDFKDTPAAAEAATRLQRMTAEGH
ncbi:MAG TPA: tol-pal system protein YbgF [Steroidobacteraceae bacterium]|nr:tol-pal system protein YbgF [Steroidobacteraceae bacterium]